MNKNDETLKHLKDFFKIRISDSESVKMRKKVINKILEENNSCENSFEGLSKMILLKTTHKNLMLLLSPLRLKKERIKSYMLYIENEALTATEIEKQQLRNEWGACNRWLKSIESTKNFKIAPPVELLEE